MRNGPRATALLVIILLAGCGQGAGNGSAGSAPANSLTGLYEGGTGPRRDQLCLIEKDGRTSFGFVRWGPGDRNCSGSGPAVRESDRLHLVLDGDASCTIEARIDGSNITFPSSLGGECRRYYCGDGADLAGAVFARTGESEADARRAVDLVGDPLCSG